MSYSTSELILRQVPDPARPRGTDEPMPVCPHCGYLSSWPTGERIASDGTRMAQMLCRTCDHDWETPMDALMAALAAVQGECDDEGAL